MPFWNFVDFSDFIYLFFLWCASFLCFFYSTISSIFTTTTPPPPPISRSVLFFSLSTADLLESLQYTPTHTHTQTLSWMTTMIFSSTSYGSRLLPIKKSITVPPQQHQQLLLLLLLLFVCADHWPRRKRELANKIAGKQKQKNNAFLVLGC